MRSSSLKASLDSELPFQRKQWRIEHIGWIAMAGLMLYALAGGLGGGGPLSTAEVVAADGSVRVRYERFARQQTPNSVEISLTQAPDGSPTRLYVSDSYLSSMMVRSMVPGPDAVTLADRGYAWVFKRPSGVVNNKIELHLEPQQIGTVEGWLVINDGQRLAIKQFVLP